MKKYGLLIFTFASCFIFILSCNKFEYSPYQKESTKNDLPGQLNANNLAKIKAAETSADDTVTIIYTGDCQRFYDRLEDLVKKVNAFPHVDFLIMSGDIADFGLMEEYVWIAERLKKLNVPFLCAIGNHDFTANGGEVYEKIFGPTHYSFIYKDYKFLFHDTNGREHGFDGTIPNMQWLGEQVKDSIPKWFVGVAHVPPYNGDFDKSLEYRYKSLFGATPGFILSLYGHLHDESDSYYYDDSVRYMTSNSVQRQQFVLLKLIHGTIIKQLIPY